MAIVESDLIGLELPDGPNPLLDVCTALLQAEVNIVQEGIPDLIPVEACYLGWQESLRNLARLVEPEINQ